MGSPPVITSEHVQQALDHVGSWSAARTGRETVRFTHEQPAVAAYLLAVLEEHAVATTSFALQLAQVVEHVYRRAMDRPPVQIGERDMEIAANDTYDRFADLNGVEPEMAFRSFMFERDVAAPELLTGLITLLMQVSETEPQLQSSLGEVFAALVAVTKAYERAHGLADAAVAKSSIGEAIEMQTGRPIPKIGRNDPCLCGSGRKFKKCCAQMHEPPPPPPKSHAEQLFSAYIHTMELVWSFLHESKRDRDARWVRKRCEQFEERFSPGMPGGVPDSMHVSYTLFDLRVPRCGKTMGELFLEREGRNLSDGERKRVRDLCDSYCGFYELIERLPASGQKRLRQLVSNAEWLVSEIDDPGAEEGEPGEIWLCRFAGPREDAVAFMAALIYPPDTRDEHERLIHACIAEDTSRDVPVEAAIRAAMKREMDLLAQYVVATAPEIDDDVEEAWVDAE
jgi:SEC-C motif